MRKYPKYKDSGIEWFGEIPFEWEILPFRYYFSYTKGSNGQKLTKTYIEENIGEYPVYSGQTENNGILGYVNEFEFNFDSPVVFTTTVGAKFMTTRLLTGNFSLSQNCLIMIKKRNCSPSFFQYLLSYDFNFRKELIPNIIQPSLRMEDLDRIITIIPSIQEQEQIVTYLDKKTILIDQIISISEKKIEILKEQRTSIINHIVTKGLNPKVKMKDSGVEWIGEIPEGWEIRPLKMITDVRPSNVDKHIYPEEIQVDLCNYTDVYKNEFVGLKTPLKQGSCNKTEYSRFNLKKGDVIITKDSESPNDIGIPCLIIDDLPNVVCGYHLTLLRPTDIDGGFLYCVFQTQYIKSYFETESNGITRYSLGKSSIESTSIVFPPFQEQQQIVTDLDQKTKEIDDLISSEQRRIQLMKEYRQSLISEVVTGKIKVTEN